MSSTNDSPSCIICKRTGMTQHFYPPNRFNGKEFYYYRCNACGSLSIFPLPTKEDFDLIYGRNDYAYLFNQPDDKPYKIDLGYKAHTYQRYQIDFLTEALPLLPGKKLLDFACGSGYYIAHAASLGLEATGIEYNLEFAQLLRKKTHLAIYSIEEFREKYANDKFDVIHLGHVLEHMTDPYALIDDMSQYAHEKTVFLIDGPLEHNACLSRAVINTVSQIKKRPYNEFEPQHLTFTTYESQLLFFEKCGFRKLRYVCKEQFWPLPASPGGSLSSSMQHMLARCSIFFSSMFKKQGNIFHFAGTLDQTARKRISS